MIQWKLDDDQVNLEDITLGPEDHVSIRIDYDKLFSEIMGNFLKENYTSLLISLKKMVQVSRFKLPDHIDIKKYNIPSILLQCTNFGENQLESTSLTIISNLIYSNLNIVESCFELDSILDLCLFIIKSKPDHANIAFKILLVTLPINPPKVIELFNNIEIIEFINAAHSIYESAGSQNVKNYEISLLIMIIKYIEIPDYLNLFGSIIQDAFENLNTKHPHFMKYLDLLQILSEFDFFNEFDSNFHFSDFLERNISNIPEEYLKIALGILVIANKCENHLNLIIKLINSEDINERTSGLFMIGKYMFLTRSADKIQQMLNEEFLFSKIDSLSKEKNEVLYVLVAYSIFCMPEVKRNLYNIGLINELIPILETCDFADEVCHAIICLINQQKIDNGVEFAREICDSYDLFEVFSEIVENITDDDFNMMIDTFMTEIYPPKT